MKEHGMLFADELVRAMLEGRKTQTRRPITERNSLINGVSPSKHLPPWDDLDFGAEHPSLLIDPGPSPMGNPGPYLRVPYGGSDPDYIGTRHRVYPRWQVGDRIWVRECFLIRWLDEEDDTPVYRASYSPDDLPYEPRWTPSIHMPKDVCRLRCDIIEVRPERVQDISEEDAMAEGIQPLPDCFPLDDNPYARRYLDIGLPYKAGFSVVWDAIYGKRPGLSWAENPWDWALTYGQVEDGGQQ